MATIAVRFSWIVFCFEEAVEVVLVVAMHRSKLSKASENFGLVFEFREDFVRFGSRWVEGDLGECTCEWVFFEILAPFFLDNARSFFCKVRSELSITLKLERHPRLANLSASSLIACPLCPGIHWIVTLLPALLTNSFASFEKAMDTSWVGWATWP